MRPHPLLSLLECSQLTGALLLRCRAQLESTIEWHSNAFPGSVEISGSQALLWQLLFTSVIVNGVTRY